MKTSAIYRKLLTGIAMLTAAVSFSSCEKNTIDPSGQFNIKVVNAASTSGPQSFTIANSVLVSGGLKYTDASPYITTASGKRLVMEFKDEGSSNVYASGELYTTNGVSFTVYMAGKGSSARVKSFEDDLATPNNGKVKIKFVHLSDNAPSDINIKDASGDDLVTNISRNIASGYKYVDPGTLTVQLYGTASRKNIGNFNIADLQAGKIYSLYFSDASDGSLSINKVLHN